MRTAARVSAASFAEAFAGLVAPSRRKVRSLRIADGWSRRLADIAGRGLGRLNWAESGPKGRLGNDRNPRHSRDFRCEPEITFTALSGNRRTVPYYLSLPGKALVTRFKLGL
jgi:hypothetical protein